MRTVSSAERIPVMHSFYSSHHSQVSELGQASVWVLLSSESNLMHEDWGRGKFIIQAAGCLNTSNFNKSSRDPLSMFVHMRFQVLRPAFEFDLALAKSFSQVVETFWLRALHANYIEKLMASRIKSNYACRSYRQDCWFARQLNEPKEIITNPRNLKIDYPMLLPYPPLPTWYNTRFPSPQMFTASSNTATWFQNERAKHKFIKHQAKPIEVLYFKQAKDTH